MKREILKINKIKVFLMKCHRLILMMSVRLLIIDSLAFRHEPVTLWNCQLIRIKSRFFSPIFHHAWEEEFFPNLSSSLSSCTALYKASHFDSLSLCCFLGVEETEKNCVVWSLVPSSYEWISLKRRTLEHIRGEGENEEIGIFIFLWILSRSGAVFLTLYFFVYK